MAGTTTSSRRGRSVGTEAPLASVVNDLIVQYNALVDDVEAVRSATSAGGTVAVTELMADHALLRTWSLEIADDDNGLCNQVDYQLTPDGVFGGSYAFTAGAAVTITVTGWVKYRIGGVEYTAEMPTTITLEDLGDITQNFFGSWRIEIDKLGACTAKSSPTVGGYSTAEKAMLALGGLAPTANAATLGYMTIVKTGSAFNIGTDNLTVATATAVFYMERGPRKRISGLNAALGAASTLTAASTTYGHGTIDANMNGLKKAQIAAGATQALTDADTIATLKFGNVLVCTNLAGTGKVTINAAGTPGVTAMSYASAALALAASDLVVDRLPSVFVPIALIKVSNQSVSTFTFKTTNWDATNITSTITDAGVAGWDRTVSVGFNSHQITRTAIPAILTAPVVPAMVAAVPSSTAIDTAGDLLAAKIGDSSGVAIAASS